MGLLRKFETSLALLSLFAGVAFLLIMCHMSFAFNCVFGIVFLTLFYLYVRGRHKINLPVSLLALVFVALQVDALEIFSVCMALSLGHSSMTSSHI